VIAGTKKLHAKPDPHDGEHHALRCAPHERGKQLAAPELEERLVAEAHADAE
jgi:hypothetical protein